MKALTAKQKQQLNKQPRRSNPTPHPNHHTAHTSPPPTCPQPQGHSGWPGMAASSAASRSASRRRCGAAANCWRAALRRATSCCTSGRSRYQAARRRSSPCAFRCSGGAVGDGGSAQRDGLRYQLQFCPCKWCTPAWSKLRTPAAGRSQAALPRLPPPPGRQHSGAAGVRLGMRGRWLRSVLPTACPPQLHSSLQSGVAEEWAGRQTGQGREWHGKLAAARKAPTRRQHALPPARSRGPCRSPLSPPSSRPGSALACAFLSSARSSSTQPRCPPFATTCMATSGVGSSAGALDVQCGYQGRQQAARPWQRSRQAARLASPLTSLVLACPLPRRLPLSSTGPSATCIMPASVSPARTANW